MVRFDKLKIFKSGEYEHVFLAARAGDSQCYYREAIDITDLVDQMRKEGKRVAVRLGKLKITDKDYELHRHPCLTIVEIDKEKGRIRTEEGDHEVEPGCVVIVPPNFPHLSHAADKTMYENIFYIGEPDDIQAIVPMS